jgi:hypothetical protein
MDVVAGMGCCVNRVDWRVVFVPAAHFFGDFGLAGLGLFLNSDSN